MSGSGINDHRNQLPGSFISWIPEDSAQFTKKKANDAFLYQFACFYKCLHPHAQRECRYVELFFTADFFPRGLCFGFCRIMESFRMAKTSKTIESKCWQTFTQNWPLSIKRHHGHSYLQDPGTVKSFKSGKVLWDICLLPKHNKSTDEVIVIYQ